MFTIADDIKKKIVDAKNDINFFVVNDGDFSEVNLKDFGIDDNYKLEQIKSIFDMKEILYSRMRWFGNVFEAIHKMEVKDYLLENERENIIEIISNIEIPVHKFEFYKHIGTSPQSATINEIDLHDITEISLGKIPEDKSSGIRNISFKAVMKISLDVNFWGPLPEEKISKSKGFYPSLNIFNPEIFIDGDEKYTTKTIVVQLLADCNGTINSEIELSKQKTKGTIIFSELKIDDVLF